MLNNIKIKEEVASANSQGRENYEVRLIQILNACMKVHLPPLHQMTPLNFTANTTHNSALLGSHLHALHFM